MTIAELFVKIGITGSDDTKREMKSVLTHVTDIGSASLATKAAIFGVVLALKNMTQSATGMGKDLFQFATLSGLDIEMLQKYQYALAQTGGSAASFTQAIEGLQQAMTGMVDFNEGAPEGLMAIKDIIDVDESRYKDMPYMIKKMQEYSQQVLPEIARKNLLTFRGMNDEMVTGMIRGTFNEKNFNKAPILKLKEAMKLNDVGVGFSNLFKEAEVGWARFIGKFGPKALEDLRGVTKELFAFGNSLAELLNSIDALKNLGKVFEGWGIIFKGMKEAVELIRQLKSDNPDDNKSAKDKIVDGIDGFALAMKGMGIMAQERDEEIKKKYGGNIFAYWQKQDKEKHDAEMKKIKPKTGHLNNSPMKNENKTKFEQTLIFNGEQPKPKEIQKTVKKAVTDAFYVMPTQLRQV